jgi:hypothetical protein
MFEKSPKGPKTLNPGKTCADCVHHVCSTQCMSKPKMSCRGFCMARHRPKQCSMSGKMCKDFKQIEWRMIV